MEKLPPGPEETSVAMHGGGATCGSNGHDACLICGYKNPWSLGLRFEAGQGDAVCGRFKGSPRLQGYEGILHGGVVAALLDAAMAHCLFHRGIQGVTGDLRVRFLQPVSCHAVLEVRSHIQTAAPPLYYLRAEIRDGGRLMAWGEATFVQRGAKRHAGAGPGSARPRVGNRLGGPLR